MEIATSATITGGVGGTGGIGKVGMLGTAGIVGMVGATAMGGIGGTVGREGKGWLEALEWSGLRADSRSMQIDALRNLSHHHRRSLLPLRHTHREASA